MSGSHARQSVGDSAENPRSGERGYDRSRTFQTDGGIKSSEALVIVMRQLFFPFELIVISLRKTRRRVLLIEPD